MSCLNIICAIKSMLDGWIAKGAPQRRDVILFRLSICFIDKNILNSMGEMQPTRIKNN